MVGEFVKVGVLVGEFVGVVVLEAVLEIVPDVDGVPVRVVVPVVVDVRLEVAVYEPVMDDDEVKGGEDVRDADDVEVTVREGLRVGKLVLLGVREADAVTLDVGVTELEGEVDAVFDGDAVLLAVLDDVAVEAGVIEPDTDGVGDVEGSAPSGKEEVGVAVEEGV